jgi:carbonic anhydrase/acetyltransferase-like protein (isoleucine patch superfamily)
VSSGAIVPKDCTLEGNIHIGEGTVLHPRCRIIAEKGSITIGKYNIIEEHSTIVNAHGTSTSVCVCGSACACACRSRSRW